MLEEHFEVLTINVDGGKSKTDINLKRGADQTLAMGALIAWRAGYYETMSIHKMEYHFL